MNKQLFIRGDLNDLQDNIIPLRNSIWINALRNEYGEITDGLKIWLFELTERNNKYDPTIFPGIIRDIGKSDEYQIIIDPQEMKYLSESPQFHEYTIKDIIGDQWFNEIMSRHPERL